MNISYNWLKDLVELNSPPHELAQKLTNAGLAVEGFHAHGDDFVLDIDLTSNRPDCLSHLGVAREISTITNSKLRITNYEDQRPPTENQNLVTNNDPDLCHRFTARVIRNVEIGPSPEWLVNRLEAIGERSINNVADITNYVMHELGQPMHSFDLDKLAGNRIVVRHAKHGETITTLDEVERKLDEAILAICDADRPVAIGGVMGGLDSSITESTTNVLLEVAYFNRQNIRQTSRKLSLTTEASYRFERGVDIENLIRASNRATEFICDLAGGDAGDFVDVYPTKFTPNEVESNDISYAIKRLTGLDVATEECIRILDSLGIAKKPESQFSNSASQIFISPSWRHDIAIEEDLVEEVARHAGYQNIAEELPPAYGAGEYQATEVREKLLRQTLANLGFDEAISYSFIDTKFDGVFELVPGIIDQEAEEAYVTLLDSVIEGAVRMRPSILPGLLEAVRHNFNQQRRDIRLFELGKVFAGKSGKGDLPNEQETFAIIVTGGEIHENRAMPSRDLGFYDAKGAVEAALDVLGFSNVEFSAIIVKHLRKGQSASISINGDVVGYLGRLNDEIAASYKFRQPIYVAEINLQTVLDEIPSPVACHSLPKYPGIVRDVSLVSKRDISFAAICAAVNVRNPDLLRSIEFVDIFEGKGMAEDERSITIRLEYRGDERTLVEAEVDAIHQELMTFVQSKLPVKLRF